MHTAPVEVFMSPMMVFVFIVFGCDALLYIFFAWIYTEKPSKHLPRSLGPGTKYRSHATTEVRQKAATSFPSHPVRQRSGFY
jgi:hypothetical protein